MRRLVSRFTEEINAGVSSGITAVSPDESGWRGAVVVA
jgi:hypothetical protein